MQVKVLESLLTFLKDYFHADGAGIPLSRLDYTATRAERLFQLFTAHTEALSAHWEVLLEDNAARTVSQDVPEQNVLAHTPPPAPSVGSGGGGMGAASRRAADVTQVCYCLLSTAATGLVCFSGCSVPRHLAAET